MNYPIFLIGFMASGKTSKGQKLARKLNIPFIDLDQKIEEKENKTISGIFQNNGEKYFRQVEAEVLRSIPKHEKAIVAVGGGTPCFHDNMEYINSVGTSIYLKRSESRILGRLRQSKQKRPLVANLSDLELKAFITERLLQRSAYYEKATVIFNADDNQLSDLVNDLKE
tara:strand:- start:105 stop:611 length:507 start_codon:yes stop_codon:yes gene_type:complete